MEQNIPPPENPVPSTPVSSPPPVTPISSHKKPYILIGTILLVVVAITTTIIFSLYSRQNVKPLPTINPTSSIPENKTFINETYGITFDYPSYMPDFALRTKEYRGENSPDQPDQYDSVYLDPDQHGGGPGFTFAVSVWEPENNSSHLSIEDWVKTNNQQMVGGMGRLEEGVVTSISINNQPAAIINDPKTSDFKVYILREQSIYSITFRFATNKDNYPKYKAASDQILSTFKFLDDQTDTANWKTYINNNIGFEIKYPSNYSYVGIDLGLAFAPEQEFVTKGYDNVRIPMFTIESIPYGHADDSLCADYDSCLKLGIKQLLSRSELIIQNRKAIRQRYLGSGLHETEIEGIWIDNKNSTILIRFFYEYGESGLQLFNQILSTFQFTN